MANNKAEPAKDSPLAIDLYCGLGGWAEGLLAEGFRVIGFDVERHDYGAGGYPGHLVIQDVTTLHGSQFRDAAVIVASPPCQAYSYRAMPWKRAKALPPPDNTLFEACFRIQKEASEAAGRYIPLIVENVRGAQPWVGRAKANFGSYYLWGDVGMVGRRVVAGVPRYGVSVAPMKAAKVPGFRFDGNGGSFQTASVEATKHSPACVLNCNAPSHYTCDCGVEAQKHNPDGTDHGSGSWLKIADSKNRGAKTPTGNCAPIMWKDREVARYAHPTLEEMPKQGFNVTAAQRYREGQKVEGYSDPRRNGGKGVHLTSQRENDGGKGGGDWFGSGENCSIQRRHGSKSNSRKAASAMIAKIPFPLAQHIAKTFKQETF